jgi:transposase, IS30 family
MISQQPPEAEDRTIPSHREGDLIIDKDSTSAIGTPVKRATQFVILPHPPSRHSAEEAHDAMTSTIQDPPRTLRRPPTRDQGITTAPHTEITLATELPTHFRDPHPPRQHGTSKNTNGLLHQHLPQGTDPSLHNTTHLASPIHVCDHLVGGLDRPFC